jgi:hypothetical protein
MRTVLYRGRRKADRTPIVIKLLKSDYPIPSDIARFKHEYAIISALNLAGVVRAIGLEMS